MTLFEENGAGKCKGSLNFVKEFAVSVKHSDKVEVSEVEDYMPMGRILGYYGKTVSDFPTVDKALAAVRHLVKKNCEENGRDPLVNPEAIDKSFPEFSKFYFCWCEGKKSSNVDETSKELSQSAELKSTEQLGAAKLFMEGMGYQRPSLPDGAPAVTNVKYEEISKAVEAIKTTYTFYLLDRDTHMCCVFGFCWWRLLYWR